MRTLEANFSGIVTASLYSQETGFVNLDRPRDSPMESAPTLSNARSRETTGRAVLAKSLTVVYNVIKSGSAPAVGRLAAAGPTQPSLLPWTPTFLKR
jgi:hypothetical protein